MLGLSEAYSVFAQPEHADHLARFLDARGIRYRRENDVVDGEDNLLIDKGITFDELATLLREWKQQYAEEAD